MVFKPAYLLRIGISWKRVLSNALQITRKIYLDLVENDNIKGPYSNLILNFVAL